MYLRVIREPSPDGTRVVSGSYDVSGRIWNTATGEIEHALEGHSDPVMFMAFSPDGTRVVSSLYDNSVRVWNTITGESTSLSESEYCQLPDGSKVHHLLRGQFQLFPSGDQDVYLSPDGNRILTKQPKRLAGYPQNYATVV